METKTNAQLHQGSGDTHCSWPNPNAIGDAFLKICLTRSITDLKNALYVYVRVAYTMYHFNQCHP